MSKDKVYVQVSKVKKLHGANCKRRGVPEKDGFYVPMGNGKNKDGYYTLIKMTSTFEPCDMYDKNGYLIESVDEYYERCDREYYEGMTPEEIEKEKERLDKWWEKFYEDTKKIEETNKDNEKPKRGKRIFNWV